MPKKANSKLSTAALLVFFLLGLGILNFYRPELRSHFDLVSGDRGDSRLNGYILEHWFQFVQGKVSAYSPRSFFPVMGTLGYSAALIGAAVPYVILRELGLDLYSAMQGTFLILDILAYSFTLLLLARGFGFSLTAAVFGAAFFAFNSPKFNQLNHLQLSAHYFLPLIALCLVIWIRDRKILSRGKAFLVLSGAAIFFNLQLMTETYNAFFLSLLLGLTTIISLFMSESRRTVGELIFKFWGPVLAATLVFAIALIPFLKLYMPVVGQVGYRRFEEAYPMVPRIYSFFWMGETNWVWGWWASANRHFGGLPFSWEHRIGVGLVITFGWLTLLAKLFVQFTRKSLDEKGRAILIAMLATTAICLMGCVYNGFTPWQIIYQYLPPFRSIRAVARYMILLSLSASVAIAYAIDCSIEAIKIETVPFKKAIKISVLAGLVLCASIEQVSAEKPVFSKSAEYAHLREIESHLPKQCDSFYVTLGPNSKESNETANLDAMAISQRSGIPTLNGYSGNFPPGWFLSDPQTRPEEYRKGLKEWISRYLFGSRVCEVKI